MRPVQFADIEIAARVLRRAPADRRASIIGQILQDADTADRYRKRLRRLHPQYGDGSLMSAALRHDKAPRPASCDALHLRCIAQIVQELLVSEPHQER
ncbi:DUF7742 family protein [Yoonia sediminilitoris]|uniref:DUF7742 domain-containing protein n=1 Tax=Yoonia sediminilitoris TaxID=1286148 RepID=A0A2T6KDM8_9RHOB|nr:hypothetical protein [Yoonia sediminilitoris]PUB13120.1 hypothetical protein C8N45_10840 [Yoonia sediminilitoris]RCW94455.1 hypothetical protein DFP92_10841 [Yoonia sediminilitoris]